MLTFTDTARERINHYLELQRSQGVSALRVAGNGAEPKLWLVKTSDRQDGDTILDGGGFEVFVDPTSTTALDGATVDFVHDVMQSGFRVFFPSPTWSDPLAQRVQDVLDQQVNPGVASHGGRITLSGVEGDTAIIVLEGGCQGCGSAEVTLKQGVEVMIKEAIPEIQHVVDATDHASGENPYFKPTDNPGDSPLAD